MRNTVILVVSVNTEDNERYRIVLHGVVSRKMVQNKIRDHCSYTT